MQTTVVRELTAGPFSVINIRICPETLDDIAIYISHRSSTDQKPTIFAVSSSKAGFSLDGSSNSSRLVPLFDVGSDVVGVDQPRAVSSLKPE
jgi:hypothetical protein